ncbi:Vacuolar protein sorting-associated protein 54, N-terminal [Dillenia turbinata]|uniref:Vacuolar protein sorting-associated protein 54, N-terminal n=1 Tax=Dillenia turbinata TaxID=194707 RepID=A0AAN8ZFH0_9MAGN
MLPNSSPFPGNLYEFDGDLRVNPRVLLFASFLLFQGDTMDLSKVGEKILSSVRSATSLGLVPSTSDRPEVPARAAAAAAVARALAGVPPHERFSLPSSSAELSSIYSSTSSRPQGQVVEELEEVYYEEDFDPIRHILEHIPSEEDELTYFEEKATVRLAQLDKIAERLSHHVMEHYEEMVKGMHLVKELEKDLKVANIICMNGRRHITSSMHEVSRDLIVTSHSRKKQALLDTLPILNDLRYALDMQLALEVLVEEGNFFKAFQVLSEYLQLLDSLSGLSAIQEMSRGVEVWLGNALQKLDLLLLTVCQEFKEEDYLNVIDAYALIGDTSGLAEKIQSYFMQEVISETHSVLKSAVEEDQESHNLQTTSSRFTYSDLCQRIPESKFRQCLLRTLAVLFKLMCSYYVIMSFQPQNKEEQSDICVPGEDKKVYTLSIDSNDLRPAYVAESLERTSTSSTPEDSTTASSFIDLTGTPCSTSTDFQNSVNDERDDTIAASCSGSPCYQLRKDAVALVSQTLKRGCKNLWQLSTSRVSVLLSSAAAYSTSIHQFLRNYEDLNVFVLAGEAFCGMEAVEFRQKLKVVCENYFFAFHRQNVYALKMVLEKETWLRMPAETVQLISFAGLTGDGAPLIASSDSNSHDQMLLSKKSANTAESYTKKSGFLNWLSHGNPFSSKSSTSSPKESQNSSLLNGTTHNGGANGRIGDNYHDERFSPRNTDASHIDGKNSASEDENEDLLADFIDEDSQLPSRVSKPKILKKPSAHQGDEESNSQTGSSICVLRLMDKYARLMQKLEIVNVEFFKGICQLFEIFFYYIFETFGQQNAYPTGKGINDLLNYRLRTALSRITQDCDQWIKPWSLPSVSSATNSMSTSFMHLDVTPTSPPNTNLGHIPGTPFGLEQRCSGVDSLSAVARILHRSKAHLQSRLLQNNAAIVEDFYVHLVASVPDLTEHIHRTTARLLLHMSRYVDKVTTAKWEVKELGLEHNGYVDLLLGEFKHYRTRLAHAGIKKEVQDILLEYGLEIVAETLVEGLSRVKRCTDEGRALMSLDLQVLINGLQHFVSTGARPKLQIVETFIKAYYLPETEYVHWARAHPEYTKSQIVGLINLVATMKGWKRKTRLEIIEKIESATL